ncbi:outer membrane protein assembly factor BamB family protein [Halopiger aswanensis]|uniref:Putative pyrroloquinoline-quinone binding quinoprotein n=1 Tax=Halopiger aswanensis TaxID=148449 RepID=A0A3R7FXI8_9EURY|nr:PQQ-binding-like beta-propeller repeat protein [Halopiger aswanensis]RKD97475.1 putative pyrroloquinoline-quinone binding quinoprotein [Halopiger aswanensis]
MADTDSDVLDDRAAEFTSVSLGEIEPARSRHMWTRSAVHATDELVAAGQWNGSVVAYEAGALEGGSSAPDLEPRWTVNHPEHAVGIASLEEADGGDDGSDDSDAIVVAGRGETGAIAAYDAATGDRRWRYETASDVGKPVKDSVFYLPYVVALESDPATGRVYAAARRYERDGETRRWHSTVYAFESDGTVRWRYETDASPIALDRADDGDRLAVGYNRCTGDHDVGLVVLEAESGDPLWTWDPGTEGDRRVGDVSVDGEQVAVASHGDKRGYLLGPGGAERWRVDLAVPTDVDGETLYAYPNHVYANDGRVAFVTGNTYAEESRETEGRHPNEHRIAAFDAEGTPLWDDAVRGFVHGLAADGDRLVAPCAQNFRVRDPDTHAVRRYDLESGPVGRERFDGVATAGAVADDTVAAIEEPVAYHDDGETRGTYRLHVAALE